MTGTVLQFKCPKCGERHVTWECPTCGHSRPRSVRLRDSHVTTTPHANTAANRGLAFGALLSEYLAEHPYANAADTTVLQVSLWLASRREAAAAAE